MIPVILLVVTLTLSVTITRIGTVALVITGMSQDSAYFQARSAFYGVGFTTRESEAVVNHPVRRRVVALLMLLGNLGVATVVATLMGSFLTTSFSGQWVRNLVILGAGLASLVIAANSRWLDRILSRVITAALRRWTTLDVHDYVALLQLSAGYAVMEIQVQPGDLIADATLKELRLSHQGILVLGIQRGSDVFIAAPNGHSKICTYDKLIVYGPILRLKDLTSLRAGAADSRANHLTADQEKLSTETCDPRQSLRDEPKAA